MKKTLKYIGIGLLIIVLGNIISLILKSNYENSLAGQIEIANKSCPITIANGTGQITAIKLEEYYLTYYLKYSYSNIKIQTFQQNPKLAKELAYLAFICLNGQNNSGKQLISLLKQHHIGLKVIMTDNTKEAFTTTLSQEYIAEMEKKVQLSPTEALHSAIALQLSINSSMLPQKIEEGLTMTNMKVEGDNIVITIELDEALYTMASIKENISNMKQGMLASFEENDPEMAAIGDLCKVSHSNLIYRTIGSKSKQIVDIKITYQEIAEVVNTPNEVDIK